jgi:hypothetical protein
MHHQKRRLIMAKNLKNIIADLDAEDYNLLFEKKPEYLKDISDALKKGKTPEEIGASVRRMRPHKWPQSKIVEGAAKYIQSQELE